MENDNIMDVDEAPFASTIYHERQVGNLCALHAINSVLQDRVFVEEDLIAIAENLDNLEQTLTSSTVECSQNMYRNGNFSIQVIIAALLLRQLEVVPFNSSHPRAAVPTLSIKMHSSAYYER